MKVLFLNSNSPDYLAESLFHGLRKLLGNDCVDVPKMDAMYAPLNEGVKAKLGNNGFSIYGLLEDNTELVSRRFYWQRDVESYDLIVAAEVWENWDIFWQLYKRFPHKNFAVVDGEDIPALFPYNNMNFRFRKLPHSFFAPVRKVKYFKREIGTGAECYGVEKYFPSFLHGLFRIPKDIYPVSMSIPEEKITRLTPKDKKQQFVSYLIDKDLAKLTNTNFSDKGEKKHKFSDEKDYYADLKNSKFGATSKREGWDCLRHYEYAANGVVLCFKDLSSKNPRCAPYDLNSSNTIEYSDANGLLARVTNMPEREYEVLLTATYKWIEDKTTQRVASNFLTLALS
jgi:hypothetical protein